MGFLGEIQGVEVYEENHGLEDIWFHQPSKTIGWLSLTQIEKLKFEVAKLMIEKGFQISNADAFNHALKNLLVTSLNRIMEVKKQGERRET